MKYFDIVDSQPIKKEGYVLILSCLDPDDDEPRTFKHEINFNADEEEKVALLYDFYKFIMPLYNKEARQGDIEYPHDILCKYLKDNSKLMEIMIGHFSEEWQQDFHKIIYRTPEEIQTRELEGDFDSIAYELMNLDFLVDRHERSDIIAEIINVEVRRYAYDNVLTLERIKEEK